MLLHWRDLNSDTTAWGRTVGGGQRAGARKQRYDMMTLGANYKFDWTSFAGRTAFAETG
jgi:hypothetical protein